MNEKIEEINSFNTRTKLIE